MRRRKANLGTPSKSNSRLNLALLAGKSIKGLAGFVNISDSDTEPVYAKVQCVGFTATEEDCSCNTDLKIRAKVVGTGSVITFTACNWLDTLKEVEADSDLNRRKAIAERQYREITNHHYLARKRLAFQAFVLDSLSHDDRKAIHQDIEDRKLKVGTLDDQQIKEYARTASFVANKIAPDQAGRYYE